jgi:hypothetical protein
MSLTTAFRRSFSFSWRRLARAPRKISGLRPSVWERAKRQKDGWRAFVLFCS